MGFGEPGSKCETCKFDAICSICGFVSPCIGVTLAPGLPPVITPPNSMTESGIQCIFQHLQSLNISQLAELARRIQSIERVLSKPL